MSRQLEDESKRKWSHHFRDTWWWRQKPSLSSKGAANETPPNPELAIQQTLFIYDRVTLYRALSIYPFLTPLCPSDW